MRSRIRQRHGVVDFVSGAALYGSVVFWVVYLRVAPSGGSHALLSLLRGRQVHPWFADFRAVPGGHLTR